MSGECILVIDDSKEIVKHLTQHVLPTFGYRTLHAFDGKSGLELLRQKKPDLVMLDYNLPEMTGLDVLQQLAQDSFSVPIILMTGYGSELSAIEAFRLGAKDYIIKPFTVDEIVETIDRALVETRLLHDKTELAEQLRRVKVEMSRQTNEMKTLSNIGKAITSLLSVDKVLERVLEAASYLTNAEESTIWMPDETGTQLEAYEQPGRSVPDVSLLQLSIADSQVGQVMRTGRPLRQSVFSGRGIKVKTGYFARAVLYVPLKLRGVTLGVLGVSNRATFRSFSKRDEFLLSFLADYAAIALENARVFQAADQALAARLEELNTLNEITRTITSSIDLDEIVRLTIKQVHDSWRIEASSLWLLDSSRQALRVLANVGTPMKVLEQVEVPIGVGFVGQVAESGKWFYTNDVASHPQHYREADKKTGFKTRSLLCVPLIFRDRVVGAMQLLNKIDGDFDDADVERALSIASAVAIAVSNALLFEQVEARQPSQDDLPEQNNHVVSKLEKDVTHLLAVSQPCDILDIVTEVIHTYQAMAQADEVALIFTAEPGVHEVVGDATQLRLAISYLIENAIQLSQVNQLVQITVAAKNDHIVISVHEPSVKVPQLDLVHVFDGNRESSSSDGANLSGLALARTIVEAHGGQAWAESENNEGITYFLKLPVSSSS